ncbi:LuxR family two component transcriptional regulator [Glaciihabitans tibetensis]|uniref:LuxR family two component transcriptional regulator n=1 Tax=Glaciihabitans tibetensis TaxID=1266600 RepID=A0A2T0V396_9MICO|nr:response regulator transcription factor [Glaciihabitans tibetensis]PRY64631.1 LuxR family two component transcriptional regulator [Glaciihabitans tibetensis]
MIRLLIADDQAIVRAGVAVIAGAEPDMIVVGEASDGIEAVRMARALRPDVVCMDIRMPNMDGIAATREIVADSALSTEVLIVTTFDLDDDIFAALEAGAAGFLLKGAEETILLGAIRSVAAGEGTLDQQLTLRVLREFSQRVSQHGAHANADAKSARSSQPHTSTSREPTPHTLTARELDVLGLLAEGLSNVEIGERLFIEPTTVKYHLAGLLQKIDARDRLQAVLWGIRSGVIDPFG